MIQNHRISEIEELIAELKAGKAKLIDNYLLVSKNGGKKFQTSKGLITMISLTSPLGQKIASSLGSSQ